MGQAELRTLQGMTTLLARRGGHIRVLLEPAQLGPVTIEIDVQGDRVRARIETSTRSASKVLDAASSRLKAALESQGFTLERFEVRQEGASESTSNADDNADDSGQEDRRLQQDGDRPRRAWTWRRPVVSDEHFDLAALAAKEASA
jgi:flagellar hook-length control protein FliK